MWVRIVSVAEHQSRCDLSRGESFGDEFEDFELACRQARVIRYGKAAP